MLPGYISKAVPNPTSNRAPWYKNTAPTYAGVFLWVVFYRRSRRNSRSRGRWAEPLSSLGGRTDQLRSLLSHTGLDRHAHRFSPLRCRQFHLRHTRRLSHARPVDGPASGGLDVGQRVRGNLVYPDRFRFKGRTRQSVIRDHCGGLGVGARLCRSDGHPVRRALRALPESGSTGDDFDRLCEERQRRVAVCAGTTRVRISDS